MRKKSIIALYKKVIKFLIIICPLVFLFISAWHPNNSFYEIKYKYQTNEVNSADDLVVGNAYHFNSDNPVLADDLDITIINGDYSLSSTFRYNAIYNSSVASSHVWTDGTNYYYSNSSTQLVFDKVNYTWVTKTWNGLSSFSGSSVWTDGTYIYNSSSYVLDVSTSTWVSKVWNGLSSFNGSYIWTDGDSIYFSSNSQQYVLDVSTSTWVTKTWNGLTSFTSSFIWSDGFDIYYSSGTNQYVLDVSTSTWVTKTWNGLDSFDGSNISYIFGNYYYLNYVPNSYRFYIYYLNGDSFVELPDCVLNSRSTVTPIDTFVVDGRYFCGNFEVLPVFVYSSDGGFDFVYNGFTYFDDVSYISSLNPAHNVISEVVPVGLRGEIYSFFNSFVNLPLNLWYINLLSLLGLSFNLNNTKVSI